MSSRLERKRNGGIFGSWFEAGQCEDSSTTLRYGRNDILGWCGRNNVHVCHPVRSVPCRIPESSHLPPMLYQLERPPTMSSRLERKRNGGIFGSWYDAGRCEDSSTSLRFGRNDTGGGAVRMTYVSVIPSALCHAISPSHPTFPRVIPTEASTNHVIPTGA